MEPDSHFLLILRFPAAASTSTQSTSRFGTPVSQFSTEPSPPAEIPPSEPSPSFFSPAFTDHLNASIPDPHFTMSDNLGSPQPTPPPASAVVGNPVTFGPGTPVEQVCVALRLASSNLDAARYAGGNTRAELYNMALNHHTLSHVLVQLGLQVHTTTQLHLQPRSFQEV
ncbi:hypothetical protein PLICRDRAFT_174432 [Plicaturopsis crispa FD-325 SS-3]|nr:hypothetical protein PLICRDRAFT_174432 [Plicaturopsis crispa FD-325 SS-3]